MSNILVIGHKNPDTDSICSALSYATFKNKLKSSDKFIPKRAGSISSETQFALDYFKVSPPDLLEEVKEEEQLILIDHNEIAQAVSGAKNAQIVEIIDHHRINGIFTTEPILVRIEPVGCTATIVAKCFFENNIEIDKTTAGLLMSAILSDSLIFKSPTCTAVDKETCQRLAKIAGVADPEDFGLKMLKAGTTLRGKTVVEIFNTDFKEFSVGDVKFGVAQVNTMDIDGFMKETKEEMLKFMNDLAHKENYSFLLLVLTDIIKEGSGLLAVGATNFIEQAFNLTLDENRAYAKGLLSRKKQVIPVLTEVILLSK